MTCKWFKSGRKPLTSRGEDIIDLEKIHKDGKGRNCMK